MGAASAIRTCLRKYFVFSGRAGRAEYWWFWLFATVLGLIPVLGIPISFALAIPGISAAVRRLHDTGRSGWWMAGFLLPFLGSGVLSARTWTFDAAGPSSMTSALLAGVLGLGMLVALIVFVVWLAQAGEDGPNRYGPDPRGRVDPDIFA